jgi:transposase
MYPRITKRKNKDGTVVEYLSLAHNERDPVTKVSVPRIVYSFGRVDKLDRDALVRLCKSLARLCELEVVEVSTGRSDSIGEGEVPDLPEGMSWIKAVELGTMLVVESMWEELGIGETLRKIQQRARCKVPYERALLAMVANRLCVPESKLGVWERWLKQVYLPCCQELKLAQFYEAMDLLDEHAVEVEQEVFFHTADLLNLDVDVIFYDTTTASFSIDEEDDDDADGDDGENVGVRKRGRSKSGTWDPQVIVALAVTRDGIPVRSWVFPGNTSDVATVEQVKADLRGWKLGRALFVGDAGMDSAENRRELAKACGKYVLAVPMRSLAEVKQEVLSRPGRYRSISENLRAKEVVVGDGARQRRYVLCHNPKEAKRERMRREQAVAALEAELGKHRQLAATAQWAIELLASKRYKRYLTISKGGKIRIDRAAVAEAAKYDGKWVLTTNDDTIGVEDVASAYKALMVIERCFRMLKKTRIKLEPLHHWLPRRIRAHVKICVLALLLERVAELRCRRTWPRIRRALAGLQAGEYRTEFYRFFRRNEANPEVLELLKTLGTPCPKKVLGVERLPEANADT